MLKIKYSFLLLGFITLLCSSTVKVNAQTQARSVSGNYLKALLNFEPWAESVWKDYPAIPGSGYFGDGRSGGNGGIRGNAGIAVAYAVLIREFPNAPEHARRLKRLQAALKFGAATHEGETPGAVATDGKKWGASPGIKKGDKGTWQSAMWAASMGFAAALVEKELDPQVVKACKRVVANEADLLAEIPPPGGFRSNTRAEENAWDSNAPALAAAWMPNDARAAKWLETTRRYLANSYSVPADSTSEIKKWVTTQTLYPSYALENHGFYHPSYQAVAGMSMGDSYLMIKFLNPSLAKRMEPFEEHNVMAVWNFIQGIMLDSGDMAYPSGLDWSLHSFEHVSYLAYLSTHFKDSQAQWAETELSRQILIRQAINGNGEFVGESCHDGFYREAVEAVRIASAYLQHQLSGFPDIKAAPLKNHITNYPDVGLLVQRSDKALITISYGAKVTALIYPLGGKTPAQHFIISPNTNSLIGGKGKARMENFKLTATGFKAELDLAGNTGAKSRMFIESNGETVAFIEVPYGASQLPADWYLMAIENHPLTGNKRTVYWKDGSADFKERSGTAHPDISSGWINIDNWVGVVAEPQGAFIYKNADKYNRNGAAEDALLYKSNLKEQPKAVIIVPGRNAAVTASVAKSVTWENSAKEIKLSYSSPDGKKVMINIPAQIN